MAIRNSPICGRVCKRSSSEKWPGLSTTSPSLQTSGSPWTIEATIRATEDGVILARGGQTLGYLLAIQQGQPLFVYRAGEQLTTLRGKDDVRNQWVTVTATVSADRRASLAVDGQIVAHGTVPRLIPRDPNDGMQVGADLASPVVEPRVPAFHGQMERLRLWRGVQGSD
ncbi:MAG: LamG-like jellyroll fold domain-containing protein [Pirellulales bacterium]